MAVDTAEKPVRTMIQPFTVEFGDEANRDILISTLSAVYRGAWKKSNYFRQDKQTGEHIGQDIGTANMIPDVPGQRMEFQPGKLSVRIFDPLADNKELLDDFNRGRRRHRQTQETLEPMRESVETRDVNKFKTLVREIVGMVNNGSATLVDGKLPLIGDIDKMDGRYIVDPGDDTYKRQTVFEGDEGTRRRR